MGESVTTPPAHTSSHPHVPHTPHRGAAASNAQTHPHAHTPGHHSQPPDAAQPHTPHPLAKGATPPLRIAGTTAAVLLEAVVDHAHYRNLAASRTAHPSDATVAALDVLA